MPRMAESNNPMELAGATQPSTPAEPEPDMAREIFPVTFEKDHLDFRPQRVDEVEVDDPKASSALESVESPPSPTGLEDVSAEDLVTSAPLTVERDMTLRSQSNSLTSDAPTSPGKTEPPVVT